MRFSLLKTHEQNNTLPPLKITVGLQVLWLEYYTQTQIRISNKTHPKHIKTVFMRIW